MSTIPQVSDAMQWVLNEYPHIIERETGFVQRDSPLNGSVFVQGLVLAWMAEPDASYSQLRSSIATLGVHVRSQAVEQRFGKASVELLKGVLNEGVKQVISYEGVVPELFARFNGVYAQDGSIVALTAAMAESYPGCGGKSPEAGKSSMRLEVRWDLSCGGMSGPWINAGREPNTRVLHERNICRKGVSFLETRSTSLLPVCVLEARLVGTGWCQQKRTCIFMTRKGSNGIWSLT